MARESKLLPLLTWRSAICDSGLPSTTRHVALTLSLYMNERGGSAHPGAVALAHDTGLSERSVRGHLADLTAGGWLTLVEQGGLKGDRRVANSYQAAIPPGFDPSPRTPAPPAGVPAPDSADTAKSPTPAADDTTPEPPAGVPASTPAPPAGVPLQLTTVTPAAAAGQLFKNSPEDLPSLGVGDSNTSPDRPGANEEDQVIEAAWTLLAERRRAARQGEPIRSLGRWRDRVIRNDRRELEPAARDLVARYPTITPDDLAAALFDPDCGVLARYRRRRCAACDDVGVVETPDGCVPCTSCRPSLVGSSS